jgi:hypothetical protein
MAEPAQSTFDFSDSYGSDPILRRYAPTTSMDLRSAEIDVRSSAASRELAEANLAKAQAEFNAKLVPMKSASEAIKSMSEMMKTRSALQEEASIQKAAAAISGGLAEATDLDSVVALGNSNLLGLRDTVAGPQWRSSVLNGFRQLTDNAQSVEEVDKAYSKIPASVAFEPEFKGLYDNAKNQALLRQNVREKYAAEPSLGAVPTTVGGQVDVTAAGLAVAAKGGEEQRRNTAIENVKILQKQIGDLRDKMKADQAASESMEPNESDVELMETYNKQLEFNLQSAGLLPSAANVPTPTPAPTSAPTPAPTATETDRIGSRLPIEANRGAGAPAAAAASNAATGGETKTETTKETVTPPISLAEEAEKAAEEARKGFASEQIAAIREKKRPEQEERIRKAERRLKFKNLKDEETRLRTSIYDGENLKLGLSEDMDIVKKVQERLSEIDQELKQ